MTIRLVITIDTRPGLGALQEAAFERLAPVVRAEAGCLQYDLHRVADNPDRFVLLERWASTEALQSHDDSPHMLEADTASREFRVGAAQVVQLEDEPVS